MRSELRAFEFSLSESEVRELEGSDRVYAPARIYVGQHGGVGEESFDFIVCTPLGLAQQLEAEDVVDGRHHFVVARFEENMFVEWIRTKVAGCEGPDWSAVALKLSRLGMWEYEDYH